MTRTRILLVLLIIILGGAAFFILRPGGQKEADGGTAGERKIAYWVAPMDPNYRRDKPGKSPMGMDLIPVYEGEEPGGSGEPALKIDPSVVNNIGVKTQTVVREDLAREINTVSTIMMDEEARSDVHVRSEGWIEKLKVEAVGEKVETGEILFEIYAPALVAAQSEYVQALQIGRPALVGAATERLTALGMAESQIAELKGTQKVRQRIPVLAPRSGIVIALNAREGMFVRPSDMAMQLADLSSVWIIADVFEGEAAWVAPGDKARMTVPAHPGESWEGKVDYVYPTAEAMTRTVQVRLRFGNPDDRLKPNMFANVTIDAAAKANVLTIPQSALIQTSKGDRVILALGEGRFRPAQVTTGIESDGKVEVLSGLNAGEEIVVQSQFLIDSEASLDSGLLRLTPPSKSGAGDMAMKEDRSPGETAGDTMAGPTDKTFRTEGRIVSIDADQKSITLDHKPVPDLNWPSMTMAFKVETGLSLKDLRDGETVRFAFEQTENGYEISEITPMPDKAGTGEEQ